MAIACFSSLLPTLLVKPFRAPLQVIDLCCGNFFKQLNRKYSTSRKALNILNNVLSTLRHRYTVQRSPASSEYVREINYIFLPFFNLNLSLPYILLSFSFSFLPPLYLSYTWTSSYLVCLNFWSCKSLLSVISVTTKGGLHGWGFLWLLEVFLNNYLCQGL